MNQGKPPLFPTLSPPSGAREESRGTLDLGNLTLSLDGRSPSLSLAVRCLSLAKGDKDPSLSLEGTWQGRGWADQGKALSSSPPSPRWRGSALREPPPSAWR